MIIREHVRRAVTIAVVWLVAALFSACGQLEQENYVPPEEVRSELERDPAPDVSQGELFELVRGNTAFSFDLLQMLSSQQGDLFFSPFSISQALAMTYVGARENTATQMADTLHFDLPPEQLHPAFNELDLRLSSRAQSGVHLSLANALWAQIGYDYEQPFLDTLAQHYGAGVYEVDFRGAPEAARLSINSWVSHETAGKIDELIPAGIIDGLTRFVLTNAIYFKADWKHQFHESSTRNEEFYLLGGGQVMVPMMRQTQDFAYVYGDGVQALEIPYEGNQVSMVVLLPDPGLFEEVSNSLDGESLTVLLAGLMTENVHLELPRFTYESSFFLEDTLGAMGMPDAFDASAADLSGVTTVEQLYILSVIHKAFVLVDEKGTEAAAATAVIGGVDASAGPMPIEFIVDRPFLFLIRDRPTGTILFLGRVLNPT